MDIYFMGHDSHRSADIRGNYDNRLYIKPIYAETWQQSRTFGEEIKDLRKFYKSQLDPIIAKRAKLPGMMLTWLCKNDTINRGLNILRFDTTRKNKDGVYVRQYLTASRDPRVDKVLMDKYGPKIMTDL
jgi:hypothetical protein